MFVIHGFEVDLIDRTTVFIVEFAVVVEDVGFRHVCMGERDGFCFFGGNIAGIGGNLVVGCVDKVSEGSGFGGAEIPCKCGNVIGGQYKGWFIPAAEQNIFNRFRRKDDIIRRGYGNDPVKITGFEGFRNSGEIFLFERNLSLNGFLKVFSVPLSKNFILEKGTEFVQIYASGNLSDPAEFRTTYNQDVVVIF